METKWLDRNRYDMEPEAWTDEDGDCVYVRVTLTTLIVDQARDWLVAHPQAIHLVPELERLAPERLTFRGLYCDIGVTPAVSATGALHDGFALQSLVVSGAAKAWFEFDYCGAREDLPGVDDDDWRERAERMAAEREQEERRHAREWRGPLWWRVQLWFGRCLAGWGARLQPQDRTSAQWLEGEKWVTVDNLRRPARAGDEV